MPGSVTDSFIAAICATPYDTLPRLIYADWLDENAASERCGQCLGRCTIDLGPKRGPRGGIEPMYVFRPPESVPCPACHGTGEVSNGYTARAEFIRVQCQIARMVNAGTRDSCDCETCGEVRALRRRERELLDGVCGLGVDALPIIDGLTRTNFAVVGRGGYGWYHRGQVGASGGIGAEFRRGFVEELTCSWSDCRTHLDAIRRRTPIRKVRLTVIQEPTLPEEVSKWRRRADGSWPHRDYPGIEFEFRPQLEAPVPV